MRWKSPVLDVPCAGMPAFLAMRLLAFVPLPLLALAGCAGMTRTVPYPPFHDPQTGTVWIVEYDTRSGQDDAVSVIVCHREASPACVRVNPQDVRSGPEYGAWLNSMPPEVRRLAQLPPPSTAAQVPSLAASTP